VDEVILMEKCSWPVQDTLHHAGMGAAGFIHGRRWGFNMPSEEAMELMEQHAEAAYALDRDTVNV